MDNFEHDEINESEEPTATQKIKEWVGENLRIIVSVLIVFLIASSIYSYSKRGEENNQVANKDKSDIEDILSEIDSEKPADTESAADTEEQKPEESAQPQQQAEEPKAEEPQQNVAPKTSEAQETATAFVESAQKGDGTTHLARRALAHYLEKNPDSSLTPEHKIYIEDYLRKNVSTKGHLAVGQSVEFSKDLIKQAIESSNNLNASQLKNLQKYSAHVSF